MPIATYISIVLISKFPFFIVTPLKETAEPGENIFSKARQPVYLFRRKRLRRIILRLFISLFPFMFVRYAPYEIKELNHDSGNQKHG